MQPFLLILSLVVTVVNGTLMKRLSLAIGFLTLSVFSGNYFAQIQVQNTLTPVELVEQVLLGSGVVATNITVNGSAANANNIQVSATYFNQNGTTFPISEGVLLTTGNGNVAVGPNTANGESMPGGSATVTDPDMSSIAAAGITNGIVLEFDFVATGNQLEFSYLFGSEEYPEFAPPNNSGFNDVFGFFLSGPGISGPYANGAVNIATVPGTTTPVSINNVNAITNVAYYMDNAGGLAYGNAIEYDGTTVLMTAFSELICGETYHIKLGISNVADQGWDSGVFLEGGSFTTNPVEFTFNTFTLDNVIYEGCDQLGTLMFTRSGCGNENDTLVAYLQYGGTAINGTDYDQLGDSVVLEPGVDTVFWQILPVEDGLAEGVETVTITIMSIIELTGDTLYSTGIFYISDNPEIVAHGQDTTLICLTDSTEVFASASGGFAPYTYLWSNGDTTQTSYVNFTGNGTQDIYILVTDVCGYTDVDTVTVVMNQTLSIDSILMLTPASCLPEGSIFATTFPFGATPGTPGVPSSIDLDFIWTYEGDTNVVFPDQGSLNNLYGGWYYLELTDNIANCTVYDSVYVETVNTPQALASNSPLSGCSPVTSVFSNSSVNATTYTWNFGNGNIVTVSNQNDISQTFYNDAGIMLIASNGIQACDDTTFLAVDVVECGCMDPQALNYNPNAVISDGSCIYPTPTVIAPNVITANGDNVNPFFFLQTQNAETIELTILNRWGNVLYEGIGDEINPPFWNATDKSGVAVQDGVYFYRYKVTGIMGDVLEGHGFLEVVR